MWKFANHRSQVSASSVGSHRGFSPCPVIRKRDGLIEYVSGNGMCGWLLGRWTNYRSHRQVKHQIVHVTCSVTTCKLQTGILKGYHMQPSYAQFFPVQTRSGYGFHNSDFTFSIYTAIPGFETPGFSVRQGN